MIELDGAKLFDSGAELADGTFSNVPSTVLAVGSLRRAQAAMAEAAAERVGIEIRYDASAPMSPQQLAIGIADGWIIRREDGSYYQDDAKLVEWLKATAPNPERWWEP